MGGVAVFAGQPHLVLIQGTGCDQGHAGYWSLARAYDRAMKSKDAIKRLIWISMLLEMRFMSDYVGEPAIGTQGHR